MDPLSAYRMAGVQGLPPMGLPGMGGAGGVGGVRNAQDALSKIIPKSELAQLSSSVLQPKTYSPPNLTPTSGVAPGSSFSGFLGNMVQDVSAKQAEAGEAMKGVISGNGVPLHQAMIAVEEASVSFQLMVEVRNRLLESYQELMRMQV